MAVDRYLRFDTRQPTGGRALLWPVRVWKVLYPRKRVVTLNLFQQAILGLAQARCRNSSEIAEYLSLDRELVAFIIKSQLIPNGWMTDSGALTHRGQQVLEEAQDASEEVRVGYAYQDGITGAWLPRFTEDLPEIEARRIDERGFPVFLRSLDSGYEDRPFRLNHSTQGSADIPVLFEAFRRYRTDHAHARQRDENVSVRVSMESLGFIEEFGVPMWVWTWVFSDHSGPQPWLVADPFGLQQAASWLRKPLQDAVTRHDGLARYIAGTIGKAMTEGMSAGHWLQSLENQVDLTLLADYGWSSKVPHIEGYLASVLRRKAFMEGLQSFRQEDVNSLLMETHNLAESVLQWLLDRFPVDHRRLPDRSQDKNWTKELAGEILQSLPSIELDREVVRRLATQNLRDIRTALVKGSSSLKALMFAALLATVEHAAHPLREISSDELALDRMLDMADARNRKAGHAGKEKIGEDEAMAHAQFVIQWTQIFERWY